MNRGQRPAEWPATWWSTAGLTRISRGLARDSRGTNRLTSSTRQIRRTASSSRSCGYTYAVRASSSTNTTSYRRCRCRGSAPDATLRRHKPHLIVYVGAMGTQDGVDHAVRALSLLHKRRSDWHAIFAGDGEARRSVEELAHSEGIASCVEFAGFIRDFDAVRSLISSADVCLAPEPLTPYNDKSTMIKILEYMALERPTVAYDLTESRYSAGPSALYARPNDPSAFANYIHELLDDPPRRAEMGALGRARIENEFGWHHSERNLLAAYERALEHASATRGT